MVRGKYGLLLVLGSLLTAGLLFWQQLYVPQQEQLAQQRAMLQEKKDALLSVENFLNAHHNSPEYEAGLRKQLAEQQAKLPQELQTGAFILELQQRSAVKGAQLLAVSPGIAEEAAGCRRLPVSITLGCNYFSLLDFLQAMEEADRFSTVDSMEIHSEEGKLTCHFLIHIYAQQVR